MREFVFSEEVLAEIRHDRYHHPHPRVQRRMEILWLKSQGLIHAEVAALADVSPRSVQRCLDDYEEGGLDQVRLLNWKGKACELDAHHRSLEQHFVENPARSAREAQKAIEELTGIRRGLSQARAFLKKSSGWAGAR